MQRTDLEGRRLMESVDLSCEQELHLGFRLSRYGVMGVLPLLRHLGSPRLPTGSPARDELGLPRY
jgi:hypothetical protein